MTHTEKLAAPVEQFRNKCSIFACELMKRWALYFSELAKSGEIEAATRWYNCSVPGSPRVNVKLILAVNASKLSINCEQMQRSKEKMENKKAFHDGNTYSYRTYLKHFEDKSPSTQQKGIMCIVLVHIHTPAFPFPCLTCWVSSRSVVECVRTADMSGLVSGFKHWPLS